MKKLSKNSGWLIRYGIFSAVLLFSVLVLILPNHQKIRQQEKKIETLKAKIQKQRLLFQFYQDISKHKKIQQGLIKKIKTTPLQVKGCRFDEAVAKIKDMIKKNGFYEEKKNPEILKNENENENEKNRDIFPLQWTMTGPFEKLWPFLQQVNSLSCMDYLELFQVRYAEKKYVITIKIWIKALKDD